jgi:alpha-methylacyl-CoA racemase
MVPLNLIGDYGGGGMFLALGLLAAVMQARHTGEGQLVDVAMCDGASLLATMFHGLRAGGTWTEPPGTNVLDGGAHFYDVYETGDGRFVAVGAIESQFYAELLRLLEIAPQDAPQWDRDRWPELKRLVAERFRTKTRDEWAAVFEDRDACVTPVLELHEAAGHRHNAARGAFVDGLPAPVPRFSRVGVRT